MTLNPNSVDSILQSVGFKNTNSFGGDLAFENTTSQKVVGLQGQPIANTAPTSGQALLWDGNNWSPGNITNYLSALNVCTLEQFGAVGDGVTNDQGAWALAIAALNAGTYGALVLGAKTYLISGGINLSATNVGIFGQGWSSILKTTSNQMILKCVLNAGMVFANFSMVGNSVGSNQNGIEIGYLGAPLDGVSRGVVNNICALNFGGTGFSNAYSPDNNGASPGISFEGCRSVSCARGFGAFSQANYVNCSAYLCTTGLYVGGGNIVWTGGDLSKNTTGVFIVSGGNAAHGIIANTNINHCTNYGVDVGAATQGMTFDGCHIYQSPIRFQGNTGMVEFANCVIDPETFESQAASIVKFSNCRNPLGYTNTWTVDSASDVEILDCRDLSGNIPLFWGSLIRVNYIFSSDADKTLSKRDSRAEQITISGTVLSTTRNLTSSRPPACGSIIIITNNEAFSVIYKWSSGTGITVVAGTQAIIGADGTNAVSILATSSGIGTPGGTNKEFQYNDSGAFGGATGFIRETNSNRFDTTSRYVEIGPVGTYATTGDLRTPQTFSFTQRDGSSDHNIFSSAAASHTFSSDLAGNTLYKGLVATLGNNGGGGYYFQVSNVSGQCALVMPTFSGAGLYITNNISNEALRITPVYNGVTESRYGINVTEAKWYFDDNITNSATGGKSIFRGQNATGTSATGGAVEIGGGAGTATYGETKIISPLNLGYFTQDMADAPQTISSVNSKANIYIITGTNSAIRALTLTRPPASGAIIFVRNNCTTFGITVQFVTGSSTGTILPGTSAVITGDGTDAILLMTGT